MLALVREDGRADLVAAHRLVDLLRQARPMPRQNLIPPLGDSRHESRAPITPALVGSGVYGAVHKLVDELCKYPGWRRDARRHAWRAPCRSARQLPAQMRGDSMGCGEDPEGIATVPAPDGYPHVTSGWGSQASARCSCRGRLATDGSHWLVLPSREVRDRSRPGLLGYRAGAGDVGRGQNKAHDLSGLAGRGVAPLVAERADEVRSAASPVEGAGPLPCPSGLARVGDRAQHAGPGLQQAEPDRRPGPGIAGPRQGMPSRIGHKLRHHDRDVWAALCMPHRCWMATAKSLAARTDPGSAPSARLAIRGRHAQRARAGSGDGRQLLRPRPAISAAGISQCRTPGMTGALPSPPGQCHGHASRTGVCTFPIIRSSRCSLSRRGAAWRPPRARQARAGFKTAPRGWRYRPGFPLTCQDLHGPHRPGNRGAIPGPPGWPGHCRRQRGAGHGCFAARRRGRYRRRARRESGRYWRGPCPGPAPATGQERAGTRGALLAPGAGQWPSRASMRQPAPIARARVSASRRALPDAAYQPTHEPISHT